MTVNLQAACFISFMMLAATLLTSGCKSKSVRSGHDEYVMRVFDSIEVHSMHRFTFNLDSLEASLLEQLSDSISHEELIQLLQDAIKVIDKHNYILTAEQYHQMQKGDNPEVSVNPYPFQGKILESKYALISVDGFLGVDAIASKNYTDSLQKMLQKLYNQKPEGWIIDLRNNGGGWIYPMLAGLGPLLGPGIKAFEITGNAVLTEYYYYKDKFDYLLLSDSVWFFKKQLPTAVLVSEKTGSAGELLTLAFRGNANTVIIGKQTAGFSTGLQGILMPDGTQICVTNCVMTDRNKIGDGGKIDPDIVEYDGLKLFERAYNWIENYEYQNATQ
jgi:hypothetical protein